MFTLNLEQMLSGAPLGNLSFNRCFRQLAKRVIDAAIGVLQVTIFDARGLKGSKIGGGTPDPYVSLSINGREEMARTKYKASTYVFLFPFVSMIGGLCCAYNYSYNPYWGEVKFILINSLTETLTLSILDHNDHRKDTDLGTASFELSKLEADATQEGLISKVLRDGKEKGEVKFDV